MLVLTRRTGDSIVIGGQIVVTILDVRGDVVRLGVEAPREIQVHRAEVYRAVQESNQAAATAGDEAATALRDLVERRQQRPATVPSPTPPTEPASVEAEPAGS